MGRRQICDVEEYVAVLFTVRDVLTEPDFQLTYARREWLEERSSWRSVIQLNLIRNVNGTSPTDTSQLY